LVWVNGRRIPLSRVLTQVSKANFTAVECALCWEVMCSRTAAASKDAFAVGVAGAAAIVAVLVVVTMAESEGDEEWHGRFRGEVGVEDCLFEGGDILG
jgi:hypothetical protein